MKQPLQIEKLKNDQGASKPEKNIFWSRIKKWTSVVKINLKRSGLVLFGSAFLFAVSMILMRELPNLIAATVNWTFADIASYVVSDITKVMINGTNVTLRNSFPPRIDDTQSEFDAGTYTQASWQTNKVAVDSTITPYNSLLSKDIVTFWNFDETNGSTTTDKNWGATGTLQNGLSFVAGKFGNAVSSPGAGFTTVLSTSYYLNPLSNDFSIAAWVKLSGTGDGQYILGDAGVHAGVGNRMFLRTAAGVYNFLIQDAEEDALSANAGAPTAGVWQHLVVKKSGTTLTVYLNGVAGTPNTNAAFGSADLSGNIAPYVAGTLFNGLVDEVIFYRKALSNAEITALANATQGLAMPKRTPIELSMPGIVSYFPMNGNLNDVVGSFDGSSGGSWAPGMVESQAVLLNGANQYVQLATNSNYDLPSGAQQSISLWFKSSDSCGGYLYDNQGSSGSPLPEVALIFNDAVSDDGCLSTGTLFARLTNNLGNTVTTSNTTHPSFLNDNRWHHVVLAVSTRYEIYVDGALNVSGTWAGPAITLDGASKHFLGRESQTGENYFGGAIDDVAIFNRKITSEEVSMIYQSSAKYLSAVIDSTTVSPAKWSYAQVGKSVPWGEPLEKPPVAYWKFDEGTGTTSTDVVGGLVATISNVSCNMAWNGSVPGGVFPTTSSLLGCSSAGTTHAWVADNAVLNPASNTISIAAWMNLPGSTNRTFLLKGVASTSGYEFYINSPNLMFRKNGGSGTALTASYTTSTWQHWIGVASSTGTSLYRDGLLVASNGNTANFVNTANNLMIAGTNPGGSVAGSIDELAIYDYPLTAAEAYQLGTGQKRPRVQTDNYEKNLAALYHFDSDGADGLNSNPATPENGVTYAIGLQSPAAQFDGVNDDFTVADAASLVPTGKPWTVMAWINTSTANKAILSKGTSGSNGYELALDASGYAVFKKAGVLLTGITILTNREWHLVAGTTNSSGNMLLYVDGVLENSNSNANGYTSSASLALLIGKSTAGSSNFSGKIDEVALFNANLTGAQILEIYKRGAAQIKTQFRTDDDSGMNTNVSEWSGGGVIDRGPVAVWHLNEGSGTSFSDSTSNANNGSCSTCPSWDSNGQIGKGIDFGSAVHTKVITVPYAASLDLYSDFTITGWLKKTNYTGIFETIFYGGSNFVFGMGDGPNTGSDVRMSFSQPRSAGAYTYGNTNLLHVTGAWHFFAAKYNSTTNKITYYFDGVYDGAWTASTGLPATDSTTTRRIGNDNVPNSPLRGALDELAIWNRELSGSEIWNLYQAGYSSSSPDGNFLHGLNKVQYVQYRTFFETIDSSLSPDVQSVRINVSGPYPQDTPRVMPSAANAFTYVTSFSETATKPAGSEIKYVLSPNNGTNWYYYNGAAWAASNSSYAQTSTASQINTNIASFDDFVYGASTLPENTTGNFLWKAYLSSDGTVTPTLTSLAANIETSSIAVAAPNGGEIFKAGSVKGVTWTPTGSTNLTDYALEYSTDDLNYNSIQTGLKNTHNEEVMSGALAVFHFDGGTSGSIANGTTTGLTDSMGAHNLTASNSNGTGLAWTAGILGGSVTGAVTFDGVDDYLTGSGASLPTGNNARAFSMWIKHASSQYDILLTYANFPNSFAINTSSSNPGKIHVFEGNTAAATSASTFNDNIWHSLIINLDGTTTNNIKIYKDGVLDQTASYTFNTILGGASLTFGGPSGSYYTGSMDEAAIFNRALTTNEIALLSSSSPGYAWTVPAVDSSTVKVRIKSASVPSVVDKSNANFTITNIALTSPVGSEVWKSGAVSNITWTSGSFVPSDLTMEYSLDNFATAAVNIASNISVGGNNPYNANNISGLVGWWHLDESSGSAADSKGSNSGTLAGGASYAAGFFGNGVNFPGAAGNRVDLGSAAVFDNMAVASVSAWIYVRSVPDANGIAILNKGTDSFLFRVSNTYNLNFKVVYDTSAVYRTTGGTPILPNVWTHVAATWDGTMPSSSIKLYVNGTEMSNSGTSGVGSREDDSSYSLYIGCNNTTAKEFDGKIDEVAIFNTVLSGANVISLASGAKAYRWTVPDIGPGTGSSTVRVRIRSASASELVDQSAADFKIAKLDVTAPNGNEYWGVGTSQTITWSKSTNVTDFKIDFSTDGGSTFPNSISASTGDVTSLPWTIPNNANSNTVVRICALTAGFTTVCDASDTAFSIPKVAVTGISAGDQYQAQTVSPLSGWTRFINWTMSGLPNDIEMHYSPSGNFAGDEVLIASNVNSPLSFTTGPVGYWRFDESSGTSATDSNTGTVHNGTLVNGALFAPGLYGNAVSLDGVNDYVTTGNSFSSVAATNTKSLAAWVKSSSSSPDGRIISLNRDSGNTNFGLSQTGGTWRGYYRSTGDALTTFVSNAVSVGTWTHLAIVQSGANVTLFVNGSATNTASDGVTPSVSSPGNSFIGAFSNGGNAQQFFPGLIDEPVIFDRALSASEVGKLALAPSEMGQIITPSQLSNTEAEYLFESNGTDTGLAPANTATLTNGPTYVDGLFGKAVLFDGVDDYVNVPHAADIDFTSADSFSVSLRFFDRADHGAYGALFSKGVGSSNPPFWGAYKHADGKIYTWYRSTDAGAPNVQVISDTAPSSNDWHHLVVVLNRTTNKLLMYLDGVLQSTQGDASSVLTLNNALPLKIGGGFSTASTTYYWKGMIDQFGLYRRALDAKEVLRLSGGAAKSWTVADLSLNTVKIRVRSASKTAVSSTSSAFLVDKLQITSPNGAEILRAKDTSTNITWNKGSGPQVPNVALDYSTNSGVTWTSITPSVGNTGSYAWNPIPNISSSTLRIRITGVGAGYTAYSDISDSDFSIAKLDVTLPSAGAEQYQVVTASPISGQTQYVNWSQTNGVPDDLIVEYSTDAPHSVWTAISPAFDMSPASLNNPSGSLIANWKFNSASGSAAADSSGNNYSATLIGGASFAPGIFGNSVVMDGSDDYVLGSDINAIDGAANLSVFCWLKPSYSLIGSYAIVFKTNNSGQGFALGTTQTNDLLTSVGGPSSYTGTANNVITPGSWNHVGFIFDGSQATDATKLRHFVNGIEQATTRTSAGVAAVVTATSAPVSIGAWDNGGGGLTRFLPGSIDQVVIFNRTLSLGEIAKLSLTPSQRGIGPDPASISGATGLWHLNETSGTASDSSGNANTGTLTSAYFAPGYQGYGVQFNGSTGKVDFGSGATVDDIFAAGGTESAWIYANTGGENSNGTIFNKVNHLLRLSGSTRLAFSHVFATTSGSWLSPLSSIGLKQWTHVAVTYDRSNTSNVPNIYINGALQTLTVSSSPSGAQSSDAASNLILGADHVDANNFDGVIDEPAVYKRMLSVGEIQALAGNASAAWTVPDAPSDTVKVRVRSSSQASLVDLSDNDFKIQKIQIISPNMNEIVRSGSAYTISWNSNIGFTSNVKIEYSTNSGASFTVIDESTAGGSGLDGPGLTNDGIVANDGSYSWVVPSNLSTSSGRIRITGNTAVNNQFTDISDGDFSIVQFDVTFPNGANQLQTVTTSPASGQVSYITWSGTAGVPDDLVVEYSTGGAYQAVTPAFDISPISMNTASSLLGYWRLDAATGTTATDSSTGANSFTLSSGAKFAPGIIGNAVYFDGIDDYATASDINVLDGIAAESVFCWIKPVASVTVQGTTFVSKMTSSNNGFGLWSGGTTNSLQVTQAAGAGAAYVQSNANVYSAGVWNHVGFVYDGTQATNQTKVRMFINGVEQAASVVGGVAMPATTNAGNTAPLSIGAKDDGTTRTNFFNGSIDEVAVFNRVLNSGEIVRLALSSAQRGIGPDPSNISGATGLWHLNETSGTASDSSGNANTGTLTTAYFYPGYQGNGVNFDGLSGKMDLGSGATVDDIFASGGTISAWIYLRTLGEGLEGSIMDKKKFTFENYANGSGALAFIYSFSSLNAQWLTGPNTLPLNQWVHAAVTYNASSASNVPTFYINGSIQTLVTQQSPSGSAISDAADILYLGNESADTRTFNGIIDEAAVYKRILTPSEIQILAGKAAYGWTVPNVASSTVKVRVRSSSQAALTDASDADFKIEKIQITNPNQGVIVRAKGPLAITWNRGTAGMTNVKIEYSTNSGSTWAAIDESSAAGDGQEGAGNDGIVANDGTYNWGVPNTSSTAARIRITGDTAPYNQITDISDGDFSIVQLDVTLPNGSDQYQVATASPVSGQTQYITWNGTAGTPNDLVIEYSTDAPHSTWNAVSPAFVNVPLSLNTASSLKGYWSLDVDGTDGSGSGNNGTFTGSIAIGPGSFGNAAYFDGVSGRADLGSAATVDDIFAAGGTESAWIYPRSLGAASSGAVLQKVQHTFRLASSNRIWFDHAFTSSGAWSTSNNAFTLNQWTHVAVTYDRSNAANVPVLYVNGVSQTLTTQSAPSGTATSDAGSILYMGNDHVNGATFDGLIDEVSIFKRSLNAGEIGLLAMTPAQKGLSPDPANVSGATGIWHLNESSGTAADSSGNANTGTLTTAYFYPGYQGNGVLFNGVSGKVNAGSAATLDDIFATGGTETAWIYARSAGEALNGVILYKTQQYLRLINQQLLMSQIFSGGTGGWRSPVGSIPLNQWVHVAVTYDSSSTANDALLYINGISQVVTESSTPSGTASTDNANNLLIGNDLSDASTFDGTIDEVAVYKRILTPSEIQILAGKAAYGWTVPDVASSTVKVRVRSSSQAALTDASDADFKISKIQITSPNGNEMWNAGSTQVITWNRNAIISNVKIEYTTDSGATWNTITENDGIPNDGIVTNTGSFNWIVPNAGASGVLIRITGDTAAYDKFTDISDGPFTVTSLSLTRPNGAEQYQTLTVGPASGATQFISWVGATGIPNDYELAYTTDGTTFTNIASEVHSPLSLAAVPGPGSNILGYWRLASDGTDSSGNGNGVTLNNGAKIYPGIFGNALYFDGTDDYATRSDAFAPSGNSERSIAFWMKSIATSGPYTMLRYGSASATQEVQINLNSGKVTLTNNGTTITGVTNVNDNNWHYIAVTHNGIASQTLYVDGKVDTTGSMTFSTVSGGAAAFNLGARISGSQHFSGMLDEVLILNRALSAIEVAQLAMNPVQMGNVAIDSSSFSTARMAAWRFDATSGTSATESINAHTGTLTNGAYFDKGFIGNAVTLDGNNDYVAVTGHADMDPAISTVSFWFKGDASRAVVESLVSCYNASTPNQGAYNYELDSSGRLRNYGPSMGAPVYTTVSNYRNGLWHHVAVTYDVAASPDETMYVDGVSAASGDPTAWAGGRSSAYNFRIGERVEGTFPFKGQIDEVAVYNRTLTIPEIISLGPKSGYTWTVPDIGSATVKIRVRSASQTGISDLSDANFSVSKIQITSPNGNEIWGVGKSHNITWNQNAVISNAKVEYSTDNGVSWNTIVENEGTVNDGIVANDGSVPWTIPNTTSQNVLVKISGADAGTGFFKDVSDAVFTISKIVVTAPNGGEHWRVGEAHNVTWTAQAGVLNDIILDYSTDGGTTWRAPTLSTGENASGTFNWASIPNTISGQVRVRVRSASNTDIEDMSDANFDIAGLNITLPNGSETLRMGQTYNITWTSGGPLPTDALLEYSVDAGHSTWTQIPGATGINPISTTNFSWTVPELGSAQTTVQVRIRSQSIAQWVDTSDADFAIQVPTLTITAPVLNQVWPFGTNQDVTWTHDTATQGTFSTDLKVEYSTDGGTTWPGGGQIIVLDSASNGGPVTSPISWGVPAGAVSNTVKIRIVDNLAPFGTAVSPNFKITGSFSLSKANGGEKWAVGFPHAVQWIKLGNIANAKIITYDTDPNAPVSTIANSTNAGVSPYMWTPVLADAKTGLKIRIMDTSDSTVYDDSNATFTISSIQVNNPAARIKAGDPLTIGWSHIGLTNTKLESSLAGDFTDAQVISASTLADNLSFNTTVPLSTTTTFKVRASDPDLPGVGDAQLATDSSDSPVTIYGTISLTTPSAGAIIASGQSYSITWTTLPANANVIRNVKIQVAKDGNFNNNTGGNIVSVVDSTPNHNVGVGSGSYSWVPNFTSNNVKMRISDADDPSPVEAQDQKTSGNFTLGGISILSPTGGESVLVGGSMAVTFNFTGSVSSGDIFYSIDDGANWTLIEAGFSPQSAGFDYSYTWNPVADAITTKGKILICDSTSGGPCNIANLAGRTYSISSGNFTIKGSFNVTTPGALFVGDPYTIQWTSTGSIPDQKIEYSKIGNFSDAVEITTLTGLAANGTSPVNQSYNWTVADAIGTGVKIRVTDVSVRANGTPATTASSGVFSIAPKLTITAPISSASWAVYETTHHITWSTTGTVNNVKIEYLAENDSYTAPTVVEATTANSGDYSWGLIPDILTARGQNPQVDRDIQVKVRITDLDPGHPSTVVESQAFTVKWYQTLWKVRDADSSSLVQNISVSESTGWLVADDSLTQITGVTRNYPYGTYTTTWSKTGYASNTQDSWVADKDQVIDVFIQNDATAALPMDVITSYTYDDRTQVYVFKWWLQIRGVLITNANLLAEGDVKIYENGTNNLVLTLADPDDEDANGTYTITYDNTSGSLDPTKLYFGKSTIKYAGKDRISGFTLDVRNEANLNVNVVTNYSFDDANQMFTFKWWLEDHGTVISTGSYLGAGDVKIFDPSTGNTLLTLADPDDEDSNGTYSITYDNSGGTLDPMKTYFGKSSIRYGSRDRTGGFTLDVHDQINKQVNVKSNYAYNDSDKSVTFNWWLEDQNGVITSALLGAADVKIYDSLTNNLLLTLPDPDGKDANGAYKVVYDNSGSTLDTNKTYFGKASIHFGTSDRIGGFTLDMRTQASTQQVIAGVQAVQAATTAIQATASSMDTKMGATNDNSATDSIFGKMQKMKETLGDVADVAGANSIFGKIADQKNDQVTILDEVQNKLPDLIRQNAGGGGAAVKGGKGRMLQRTSKAYLGDTTQIRFQFDTGVSPTVDIYDPANKQIVSAGSLREIGATGIYNYDFKIPAAYATGEYTVIVKESVNGFMDSMILQVLTPTAKDDRMSAAVSNAQSFAQRASAEATRVWQEVQGIKGSLGSTDRSIGAQLGDVTALMSNLKSSISVLTGGAEGDGGAQAVTISTVHDALLDVMGEVRQVAGRQGINMDAVYTSIAAQQQTAKEIQNMVIATEAAASTTKEILEKAQEKPVMTTWFENPSSSK